MSAKYRYLKWKVRRLSKKMCMDCLDCFGSKQPDDGRCKHYLPAKEKLDKMKKQIKINLILN